MTARASPNVTMTSSCRKWARSPHPRDMVRQSSNSNESDDVEMLDVENQGDISKKSKTNEKLQKNLVGRDRRPPYARIWNQLSSQTAGHGPRENRHWQYRNRFDKQKKCLCKIAKEIEGKQQTRLESLQRWEEANNHRPKKKPTIKPIKTSETRKGIVGCCENNRKRQSRRSRRLRARPSTVRHGGQQEDSTLANQCRAGGASAKDVGPLNKIMAQTIHNSEKGEEKAKQQKVLINTRREGPVVLEIPSFKDVQRKTWSDKKSLSSIQGASNTPRCNPDEREQ